MNSRLFTPNLAEFPKFLKSIEAKWSGKLARRFDRERFVAEKDARTLTEKSKPRYILSMFPYPSGRLHLGHVRIYTSGDVLTRYSKLMANNSRVTNEFNHVINPMGFDSFGLPAENAARDRGLSPSVWTNSNIRTMKQQLDDLAVQFNWREATSNPNFYKWTQSIFLKLLDHGLIYKSFAQVNWDPIDKTVLADEQVDIEGRSWRSGALVEKRFFRQWFVKVNAFTKAIFDADEVDPETWQDVLTIQRNWIGKPTGWLFYIPIKTERSRTEDILPVFTHQPELFLSEGSKLIIDRNHWLNVIYHVSQIKNPFTKEFMDVIVTDNIESLPSSTKATLSNKRQSESVLIDVELGRNQVIMHAKLNNLGGYLTSDKYRDWLVSRQRFWGTPIPVIYCQSCGYQRVPDSQLPVLLPNVKDLVLKDGYSTRETVEDSFQVITPIEALAPEDWFHTNCPSCGSKAKRECETLDTLFDSSWYFLRYATEPTSDRMFNQKEVQPVWCYIGGKEHASMHLFYARFITHFLHSIGELKFREPFKNLLVQGVVKSKTFKLNGRYITKDEADLADKKRLLIQYEKMSKSKGNGVDPQVLLDTYGIDATRLCLMSYANPRSERLWRSDSEEFKDILVYLRRVALTVQDYVDIGISLLDKNTKKGPKILELNPDNLHLNRLSLIESRNRCAVDAIFNIQETYQFRQYISALHVLTAALRSSAKSSLVYTKEFADALAALIVMLNPIVPHFSEELWSHFSRAFINPLRGDKKSTFDLSLQVCDQPWPIPDADYGRSRCFKPPVDDV